MALVSGGRSTLNPDAPLFIPAALRQVEDFSPEWWQLVTTSTWYRDYWLSEHPEGLYNNVDSEDELHGSDVADLLPDTFDLNAEDLSLMESQFEEFLLFEGHDLSTPAFNGANGKVKIMGSQYRDFFSFEEADLSTELFKAIKGLKGALQHDVDLLKPLDVERQWPRKEPAKYVEKPAKNVNVKCSPRVIQQPR